ncbi:MAG: NAD(P)-dependent glycerol-1-phosphate dehydrogenase [Candidatus Bathyarchaeia archaeon]
MYAHYMQLPREVIIGTKVLEKLGKICEKFGFHEKVLVIRGTKMGGLHEKEIDQIFDTYSISTNYFTSENSTIESVRSAEKIIAEKKPSVVIGLGGGKVIDVAKLSSANRKLHFISVPTAASHDGIASSQASIKGLEKPYSLGGQAPIVILADISLISKSPYRLLASGCGDVVAKYTAVHDWKLGYRVKGEYYGDYAAELALMSSRLVMKNAAVIKSVSEEAVRTVVEALISCGVAISIAGSSRPCSGSEHMFSHALSMITSNTSLHGEQCGVGAIMSAYLQKANWRLVKNVLKKIGAPTNASQLGVEEKYIVKALTMIHQIRPERYTVFGDKGITARQAERLAKRSGVIS